MCSRRLSTASGRRSCTSVERMRPCRCWLEDMALPSPLHRLARVHPNLVHGGGDLCHLEQNLPSAKHVNEEDVGQARHRRRTSSR